MNKHNHITINHVTISNSNLQANKHDISNELYEFLKEWFNNSETISCKTSGSTGSPKTIHIKKEWMINSALATIQYLNLIRNETALLSLPIAFIGGKMMVVRAIVAGYNLIEGEITANPLKNFQEPISFLALTPHQFNVTYKENPHKIESIKTIIIGGAPINYEVNEIIKTLPNDIYETFGMTETVSHIALKLIKKQSSFSVLNHVSIASNKDNQLVITSDKLGIRKLVTNDIIKIISPSNFKWLGRVDNVINSGGIKLHPEIIEHKLSEHFIGYDFFVSYEPHKEFGNQLILIHNKPNLETQKISLSNKFHLPKRYIFTNKIMKTKNGKIARKKTREILFNNQLLTNT